MKSLNYAHVIETNCGQKREEFEPGERCDLGGLPEEHPTWDEWAEVADANSPFKNES